MSTSGGLCKKKNILFFLKKVLDKSLLRCYNKGTKRGGKNGRLTLKKSPVERCVLLQKLRYPFEKENLKKVKKPLDKSANL